MKKFAKNILAMFIGLLISFFLVELVLNIYNPLPSRFRGDKIQLKTNLKKRIVIEPQMSGLDSVINYSVNGLGFRGEEKENGFDDKYSIITVGGSTTECSLLDDSKTWTAVLGDLLKKDNENLWINNAGLDGATTYGHNILMDDYILKLKPNMVVFLIGINDLGKTDFSGEDGNLIDREEPIVRKLLKKSETANLVNNIVQMYKTHKVNINHGKGEYVQKVYPEDTLTGEALEEKLSKYRAVLPEYLSRISALTAKSRKAGITPVYVTQSLTDTGYVLKKMSVYNDALKEYCEKENILCIDLANEIENKREYYYDNMHYTNLGSAEVARILYSYISKEIKKK